MEPISAAVMAVVALGNVVLGFFGLWQRAKKRKAEDQFNTVSEGIAILEKAIEDNKTLLATSSAGREITQRVKRYGPSAARAVSRARDLAESLHKKIMEKHPEVWDSQKK